MATDTADIKKDPLGSVLRRRLETRLKRLCKADRKAVAELAQLCLSGPPEDQQEAWAALCEIVFPEDIFDQLDIDEEVDEQARARVDAYRRKVGEEIRKRRVAQNMTQEQLAEAARIPQSHVSRLERGKHAPTHVTIERLAKALGTTPKQLDPGFDD